MRCLIVLTLAALAIAQTPERPKIAETFEAMADVRLKGREGEHNGTARWYSDAVNMRELETSVLDQKFRLYRLARFDLKKEYTIVGNDTHCEVHPLGEFHAPFGWLAEAKYEGEHEIHTGVKVQIWAHRADEFSFVLGVLPEATTKPYFFERDEGHTVVGYEFKSFLVQSPPTTSFNVPSSCTGR